ncbi:MAG: hypothetical protein M1488_01950 [Gammaproteobacteria bacterium]|nr:hypothetical protein [Gammaproteobacteria bacterium]
MMGEPLDFLLAQRADLERRGPPGYGQRMMALEALGDIVDQNLGCRYPNLHICDASVIPEPWGLPPTLTLLTLARYLARILAQGSATAEGK